jgi:tetratricopeptide (TPR) repeat protein
MTERRGGLSRRDLLMAPWQRFQRQDSGEDKTGWDDLAREGDQFLQARDFQQALVAYRKCVIRDPEHTAAQKKMALCYVYLERYEQARKILMRLSEGFEDDFIVLYLGLIEAYEGDLESAFSYWSRYSNYDQPLIQREINCQRALDEVGEDLVAQEVAQKVFAAIEAQRQRDNQARL